MRVAPDGPGTLRSVRTAALTERVAGWRQQTTIRAFFSHWPTIAGVTTLSRANFAIRVGGDFIAYGESHQSTLFAGRKPKYGEDGLLETVETIGAVGAGL